MISRHLSGAIILRLLPVSSASLSLTNLLFLDPKRQDILLVQKGKFLSVHAVKVYRGIRGTSPLILNLGTV